MVAEGGALLQSYPGLGWGLPAGEYVVRRPHSPRANRHLLAKTDTAESHLRKPEVGT